MGSLNPERIWITRSEPGATRLAQHLEQAGLRTLVAPVLEIVPVPLDTALPDAFDLAVVVSEHAVVHAPPTLWQRAAEILAVGAQTARVLADHGVRAEVPQVPSSEGLLQGPLARRPWAGQRIALVSGQGGRTVLRDTLVEAGAQVFEAEVYRRAPVAQAPAELDQVGAIVVSSGDGFEAAGRLWFGSNQRRDVPVFAPSQRVVELAAQIGFRGATDCGGADPQSVLAALVRAGLLEPDKVRGFAEHGRTRNSE